jgi:uncharacterized protein YndB with AHSA1/START domain
MSVDDDTTLLITRIFDAPREQVFDAWLTREEWQAWIGPEGVRCDVPLLEAHVGGRYRIDMHMPDDTVLPVSGSFKVIDRPRSLSFTWGRDGDPSRQSLITLSFNDREGATELTFRQEGLGSAFERDQHGQGWSSALNKLQRHLDQEQPR